MRRLLHTLLFMVVLFIQSLKGQVDTEFWFAAPEVSSIHADRPIYLRVSALQSDATVSITIPSNSSFQEIIQNITANTTVSIDLTSRISLLENTVADEPSNRGLYIKSSAPITVYYEVLGTSNWGIGTNSDIFVLKGNHALGLEFYTPFQTHWDNFASVNAWASFDIVATENNTSITITPSKDIEGHPAGVSYTIQLQRGQTYSARATSIVGTNRPSGSRISANKPIAVTVKDDSVFDSGSYDLLGDQIIPVQYIGKTYITLRASETNDRDRIYLVAAHNNTSVFLNGSTTPAVTLNQGQAFEILLTTPSIYIDATDSIYVWHVAGFGSELGAAILPPLACTGSRQVSFTRSTDEFFNLAIVIKNGYQSYFKLNNNTSLVPASAFSPVAGSAGAWVYANIPFTTTTIASGSTNILRNDSSDFQLATFNGSSTLGFRYGYFSDFGFLELGSNKGFCQGDNLELFAGFNLDSYAWNTGANTPSISVQDTGWYSVTIKKGVCTVRDSVKVFYYPPITTPILGNDTAVCSNIDYTIASIVPYTSYSWSTGSTDRSIVPQNSGVYTLEVKNEFGCKKSDLINIIRYPTPQPIILYDPELERFCKDSIILLQSDQPYASYIWSTGDTTNSIFTTHNENDFYKLTVTDVNGCINSTELQLDCSPIIGLIPNLITPNGDDKNDTLFIRYLRSKKWTLELYNRWGDRVYQKIGYDNSFSGAGLEEGIYYFAFNHIEGKGSYKGWLHIIR